MQLMGDAHPVGEALQRRGVWDDVCATRWGEADARCVCVIRPAHRADVTAELQQLSARGAREVLLVELGGAAPGTAAASYVSPGAGLACAVVRTAWVVQDMAALLREAVGTGTLMMPSETAAVAWVDARDIARTVSRLATEGIAERHDGRVYDITGPEALAFRDVATMVSVIAGRRIARAQVAAEAFAAAAVAPGAAVSSIGAIACELVTASAPPVPSPDYTRLTGRVPLSVAQYLRDTRGAWMPAIR